MSEEWPKNAGSLRWRRAEMEAGRFSARAMLDSTMEQAQAHSGLNALSAADWESAHKIADERDKEARSGLWRGPLHGIPISVKDIFPVRGMPLRAGTRAALPSLDGGDAAMVSHLRQAGAVIFAKTNMNEIALGVSGENVWTGDVLNPHDHERQAGGSSSGSAVAVAVGIGTESIGSDTGGSVRIPASFCGVVGFKPTFNALPTIGAIPLSWTCDHAGLITRHVEDAKAILEACGTHKGIVARIGRRPRLGVLREWLHERMHEAVRDVFDSWTIGARDVVDIVPLQSNRIASVFDMYTTIVRFEAAFVHRAAVRARDPGFSPQILAALDEGARTSLSVYQSSLAEARAFGKELDTLLHSVDAIVLPTCAAPVPKRGEQFMKKPVGRWPVREAMLGQTLPFSLCGVPAISIPLFRVEGMPLGLQLVSARGTDFQLLALAEWVQQQLQRPATA